MRPRGAGTKCLRDSALTDKKLSTKHLLTRGNREQEALLGWAAPRTARAWGLSWIPEARPPLPKLTCNFGAVPGPEVP